MIEMEDTRHIRISDFDYDLPDARIAKFPLERRDSSKLLLYRHGEVSEDVFSSLPRYIDGGALMLFNNTKVIQARLHFRKATGALIEVFCLEPYAPGDYLLNFQSRGSCQWLCMVGNLKKWKEGVLTRTIPLDGRTLTLTATNLGTVGTSQLVRFAWDGDVTFSEVLEAVGELPIPPYLNREAEESDKRTYQTVYSKIEGSVAAPTAGLHFTEDVLQALSAKGVECDELTLHVGAGTFRPVKSDDIGGHVMHTETIAVRRSTIERLLAHGAAAVAVGTTSVRTVESLYYIGVQLEHGGDPGDGHIHVGQWEPYGDTPSISPERALRNIIDYLDRHGLDVLHASTGIMIAPGYTYHYVKAMVTNFHQPKSTLLLLVSAFVGGDWRRIYDYALSHDFRFLSYGDSSLLLP